MADATTFKRSRYMSDAILTQVTSLGVSPNAQVANLARSGQLGTGIRFTKLDGATPAVLSPVVGVVLSMPSMWDRWPKLQEMGTSIMQTYCKSITGIDFGYTLETQDTPVGHDGQMMKVPTKTTRSAVNPTAVIPEYPGFPVYNLFRTWMFHIKHPDTNASILPANISDTSQIPGWFMSAYSMSMAFIQYDPSGLPDRIYDACVITNMFPTEIGEIGFERTIGTHQLKERSINFAGIVQHNDNTKELGFRIAELLALHKINYNFALPGLAGSTEVDSAIQTELRSYGGLAYESNGDQSGVEGSSTQFKFTGAAGEDGYSDTNSTNARIPASGAATANP